MIKQFIYKYLWWTYRPIKSYIKNYRYDKAMKQAADRLGSLKPADKRVFYLGITAHSNLGDLGQHYCIKKWIGENYPDYEMEMFEADPVVYKKYHFVERFAKIYRPQDVIVFQSGYCTQDLGGFHNLMHEMIVEAMPEAHILMLPQTVFFEHEENQKRTGDILNKAKNMLFLARDFVSFETAKKMMPDIRVEAFPDIVTTLIGTMKFNNERNGVCLCTRNDGEKLYTDEELSALAAKLEADGVSVFRKDTQSKATIKQIRKNLQGHIEAEIESYSHYKVTITDRYHGTIYSLCAGTPVIIIKTTDHKVTTGADWFKGVYDDYVYVAKDLDEAYSLFFKLQEISLENKLKPHMKTAYYDRLRSIFETESDYNNK